MLMPCRDELAPGPKYAPEHGPILVFPYGCGGSSPHAAITTGVEMLERIIGREPDELVSFSQLSA